jgi:Cu2+-exporting ATPase
MSSMSGMSSIDAAAALAADAASPACAHCALPVPAAERTGDDGPQFCCQGCRTVYAAIREGGLAEYYAMRESLEAPARPALTTGRAYAEFDDPAFTDRHVRGETGGMLATDLLLEGVHCAACVWLVEKVPSLVAGVAESRLDLRRQVVRVRWDPATTSLSSIARRLDRLGYPSRPFTGRDRLAMRRAEDRRALVRIAVAGAVAGNVMLIAFALYGGMFHGMEATYATLFRWTSLALAAVSLAWPGRVFFRGAWAALRARTAQMDVPIAIGLAAGMAWSTFATVTGAGEVYFDSITILVFLLLVGRWIQQRQQRTSQDAVELLYTLTPATARRLEDGTVSEVAIESIAPGDLVEVRGGDAIPADGAVTEGASRLDLSLLTGESRPEAVVTGDRVSAGTTNLESRIVVEVDTTGEQTRVGRLMQLVADSAQRRAPVIRLADRIAGFFVTIVLALALVTVLTWWNAGPERAIANAISLLIITCPCALGLATPLAVIAGIGRAARTGILVKGGHAVECLARPGAMLLDKTGTLTEGRVALRSWEGDEELRRPAAVLERASSHPIARAFAHAAPEATGEVMDVVEIPGTGIEGTVDGRRIAVGSARHLEQRGVAIPDWARRARDAVLARAESPIFVVADGRIGAVAGVGDALRADVPDAIRRLRDRGWSIGVLSGDHPEIVDAVARALELDPDACRGGVSPEEKVDAVERAAGRGPVVMVGDGVNDAAALAAATVGIAVRGSAESSLAIADVFLARPGLTALADLVDGSRRTMGVIRRNLVISLAYNVIGVTLAMAGAVNPLVAAILMPMSSLTVLGLSFRSRTFEQGPAQ